MMQNKIYLPGLNGIRAIAAIAVVVSHTGLAFEYFNLKAQGEYAMANYGVTFFFALSGFMYIGVLKDQDPIK